MPYAPEPDGVGGLGSRGRLQIIRQIVDKIQYCLIIVYNRRYTVTINLICEQPRESIMAKNKRNKELFESAMIKMVNDKLGESIDLLDEVITDDPDDRLAFMARGTVYLKMGNPQEAYVYYKRSLKNRKDDKAPIEKKIRELKIKAPL